MVFQDVQLIWLCSGFRNVCRIHDISASPNAPTFNLNSLLTTPGGTWYGNGIQTNGDINVGGFNTIITAIYTLPNGCSDTLLINVEGTSTQLDDTLCQRSGNYPLTFSPPNGVWSVPPDNPQLPSSCPELQVLTSLINKGGRVVFLDGFQDLIMILIG